VWTNIKKALESAPHAFGISEAAFLGDGVDRQHGLFEFEAGRVRPRAFGAGCPSIQF
jgi:hypothetical protein